MRGTGRTEEDRGEEKSANGQQRGGGGNQDHFNRRRPGEKCEKLLDFSEVGKRTNVEGRVHELEQDEEDADDRARSGGQFGRGGEHGRW